MMHYVFLVFIVLLSQLPLRMTVFNAKFTGPLMEEYLLKCGFGNFCGEDKVEFLHYVSRSYENYGLCEKCSCAPSCLQKKDCCPDVYFRFPQNCREVEVLDPIGKPRYYALVDQCPHTADASAIEKCEDRSSMTDMLNNPPVTSNGLYPHVFFNEHCARCNGITNFTKWNLEIKCPGFADFNFVSSNEELLQTAKESNCLVRYSPLDNRGVQRCQKFTVAPLEYCPDNYPLNIIRFACESQYVHRHSSFKNIFCEICNTPEFAAEGTKPEMTSSTHGRLVISDCNVTGIWEDFDEEVVTACKMYGRSTATYIFKNVFCYICNINISYATSRMFLDINGGIIDERFYSASSFLTYNTIHLGFSSFKTDHVISVLENSAAIAMQVTNDVYNQTYGNSSINLTFLTSEYIRMTVKVGKTDGEPRFCLPNDTTPSPCVCDSTCDQRILENMSGCCGDFLLSYPVACVPEHLAAQTMYLFGTRFKMVSGCYLPKVNAGLKTMCEDISTNALQQIPVTFRKWTYRNVYCFLCNNPSTYNDTISTVQQLLGETLLLWNITLHGNKFIDTKYFVRADWLFNYAMNTNYYIQFRSVLKDYCYRYARNIPNIVKCNATGKWPSRVDNLMWACEAIEQDRLPAVQTINVDIMKEVYYKNKFCLACNPGWSGEYFIEKCNVTGTLKKLKPEVEFLCKNSTPDEQYWPFKNYYCKSCNPKISWSQKGVSSYLMPGNSDYYGDDSEEDYNTDLSLDTHDILNVQGSACGRKVFCRIRTDIVGFEEDDDNDFSLRQLFALSTYEITAGHDVQGQCIASITNEALIDVSSE